MLRIAVFSSLLALAAMLPLRAAERAFDLFETPVNEVPRGFRTVVGGGGKPAEWKVILDAAPRGLPSLVPGAAPNPASRRPVLAQMSVDPNGDRFPMLVFDEETFGDFKLTTQLKLAGDATETLAGIAFRVQDEKNYYVFSIPGSGDAVGFFKVVDGRPAIKREAPLEVPRGQWHEFVIECHGNEMRLTVNGKKGVLTITDSTGSAFPPGKFAFWTKSDSIAYFAGTKLSFTPLEPPVQGVVRDFMQRYPRLIGLKVISGAKDKLETKIVASDNSAEVGQPGDEAVRSVIERDAIYYGRADKAALVTMPLHDRNGDIVGAVRVVLKAVLGQTEQNAVARALPIVKEFERRVRSAEDLQR